MESALPATECVGGVATKASQGLGATLNTTPAPKAHRFVYFSISWDSVTWTSHRIVWPQALNL